MHFLPGHRDNRWSGSAQYPFNPLLAQPLPASQQRGLGLERRRLFKKPPSLVLSQWAGWYRGVETPCHCGSHKVVFSASLAAWRRLTGNDTAGISASLVTDSVLSGVSPWGWRLVWLMNTHVNTYSYCRLSYTCWQSAGSMITASVGFFFKERHTLNFYQVIWQALSSISSFYISQHPLISGAC